MVSIIIDAIEFSILDKFCKVVGISNIITRILLSLKYRSSLRVASLFLPRRSSSVTIKVSPPSKPSGSVANVVTMNDGASLSWNPALTVPNSKRMSVMYSFEDSFSAAGEQSSVWLD